MKIVLKKNKIFTRLENLMAVGGDYLSRDENSEKMTL